MQAPLLETMLLQETVSLSNDKVWFKQLYVHITDVTLDDPRIIWMGETWRVFHLQITHLSALKEKMDFM